MSRDSQNRAKRWFPPVIESISGDGSFPANPAYLPLSEELERSFRLSACLNDTNLLNFPQKVHIYAMDSGFLITRMSKEGIRLG